MNASNKIVSALLLTSSLLLGACSDEDDSRPLPPRPQQPQTFSCKASVAPTSFDYTIVNDFLHVGTDAYPRVGAGTGALPVFGTWHVITQSDAVGSVSLDLRVEEGRVTAIADCDFGSVSTTATATSTATITDGTIIIHDADEDTQYVTR
jgi:hypothetical protein